MKNTSYISLLVLLGALGGFAAGCKPSDTPEVTSAKAIDQQLTDVRTAANETAKDLSAYTYAQKKDFVATMEAQLVEMENNLDELSGKIAKSNASVRAEAEPKLVLLRAKKESLEKQLEAVKAAEASTWEMVKTSTGRGYDDLKTGFNDLRQWLSDKMAP